jgi:hypothetical protein
MGLMVMQVFSAGLAWPAGQQGGSGKHGALYFISPRMSGAGVPGANHKIPRVRAYVWLGQRRLNQALAASPDRARLEAWVAARNTPIGSKKEMA